MQGIKKQIHNECFIVSSGIPSLDVSVGGGIIVGSLVLIEQSNPSPYPELMSKYFLSEGIIGLHGFLLATDNATSQTFVKELPAPIKINARKPDETLSEKMVIAWRYEAGSKHDEVLDFAPFGNNFDLTQNVSLEMINRCRFVTFDSNPNEKSIVNYSNLFNQIQTMCLDSKGTMSRVVITSIGSFLWGSDSIASEPPISSLILFLMKLKALVVQSQIVVYLTWPSYLFSSRPGYCGRIRAITDYVFRLETFAGSSKEHNPAFKEFHGLFHIDKLPEDSLSNPIRVDTSDLAFKLRRKRFNIEKLHLPPDLSETASRGALEDPVKKHKQKLVLGKVGIDDF